MKRRPFSLIELLMAIGIISLFGAYFAIDFLKSHRQRQEKTTFELVQNTCKTASQLAKVTHSEVTVIISKNERNVPYIFIAPDIKASERVKTTLSQEYPLNEV